jgi:hypothetical protein
MVTCLPSPGQPPTEETPKPGLIDYRHGGGVPEVGFKLLVRPFATTEPNPG